MRHVRQKESFDYRSSSNVNDVQNAPSRLIFSGSYDFSGMKFGYLIENGVAENVTSGKMEVNVRKANIWISSDLGTLLLGKDSTAASLSGEKQDSLALTGFSLKGRDQLNIFKSAFNNNSNFSVTTFRGIGYAQRGRVNLMGYKSPKYLGF